ncbi:MAG TPA: SCO family protein [Terracidiphilus sp.]|jgi:protein SCO1/2|nr:SCO family protein [Terracidiphilus sp.]
MQNEGTMRRRWLGTVKVAAFAAALCAALHAPSLMAQVSSYGDKETGPTNDKPPSILGGVGIAQNLNAQLPLSLTFTDDQGKQVELGSYFGRKPAILALVYYQCPMLCSEELNGLTGALQMVDEAPGKDFNVIVVSIDPSEGTDLAAAKKRSYVKRYGHSETAAGWHFMTGTQANIDALTKAVGFGYVKIPGPDGKLTQFAHASAIQIVTPEGKLAQYYMGVEYSPKDLRLGLAEASSNRIGSPVDNILTYCYHYDPQTNKHSLIVARVVQLGGLVTLCSLGSFMFVMFRRDIHAGNGTAGSGATGTGTKVNG